MERGHIMDIQVLEYIVTIADCGSISRAAQKLFITQSGLNQQLIKLENRLGIKIFERDNHHLEITPAGQLIVDSATEILRIRRNTLTQLSDLQSSISGLISLGLTHEHGIDVFTAIYQQFHQRYPHINFSLKEKIVADQYQMLGRGSLDLGSVLIKKLPAEIQVGLKDKKIDMGHARALIPVDDPEVQLALYEQILAQGLSVRNVEEMVRNIAEGIQPELPEKKKSDRKPILPEEFKLLKDHLSRYFNTKVQLTCNEKGKGKITIPFATEEELEQLIGLLDKLK